MKKLEERELQELQEIQRKLNDVVYALGNLELQMILNNLSKDDLKKEINNLKNQEKILTNNIQQKYGDGSINLETGEFSPL